VRETAADLEALQAVLDASHAAAGPHLRSIFGDTPMSADDLVRALDGVFEMHLATATRRGAPLVAPIDGLLFHGQVWFGIPAAAVRARLVRRRPEVSASYTRDSMALIVHGTAREVEPGSALGQDFEALVVEVYTAIYGPGWAKWRAQQLQQQQQQQGWGGWIEPRRMFAKR
jgi:hypothetical protein